MKGRLLYDCTNRKIVFLLGIVAFGYDYDTDLAEDLRLRRSN